MTECNPRRQKNHYSVCLMINFYRVGFISIYFKSSLPYGNDANVQCFNHMLQLILLNY